MAMPEINDSEPPMFPKLDFSEHAEIPLATPKDPRSKTVSDAKFIALASLLVMLTCFGSGYQGSCLNIPRPIVESFVNSSFQDHFGGDGLSRSESSLLWGILISVTLFAEILTSMSCAFIMEKVRSLIFVFFKV